MPSDTPTSERSVFETWTHRLQVGGFKVLRVLRSVAQAAADQLTKKLFLAAYEASDDAYWRRHATQCEWRSLDGIIEYTTDLLTVPSDQATPIYLIAIRATSNTDLAHVAIKVKAKKSGVIHQQQIRQKQLCGIPVRKALTAIPLKSKSSKGAQRNKLGDIYIRLMEAVDSNGVDLAQGRKISDIFASTGRDSEPHRHAERWGQYWNIDEINVEKQNIKSRYYRQLIQSAGQLWRPLTMRRTAYRLLAGDLGLALTFWAQNLWNADGIRASIAQADANDSSIRSQKSKTTTASQHIAHSDISTEAGS